MEFCRVRMSKYQMICLFILCLMCNKSQAQSGPDGWSEDIDSSLFNEDMDIPPDLKLTNSREQPKEIVSKEQWFFKRMLSIVLKGGQLKKNEDNSVDIKIQMRFDSTQYELLDSYMVSDSILTDDMFRRSLGYIEEAVYKPSIIETKIVAWSESILYLVAEYKIHITWGLALMALLFGLIWFCKYVAYHHKLSTCFILFYLYEAFVSYKEAEKKEIDNFISSMNRCQWLFWRSTCEIPPPDPLIFLKHMNPLKIVVRMFTNIISEPLILLSSTIKTMVEGIAEGLWYPFDKILYAVLIVFFNVVLLVVLLSALFNYLLNVPFNLSIPGLNLGIPRRSRAHSAVNENLRQPNHQSIQTGDTISQPTLNRILDIVSRAIPNHGVANQGVPNQISFHPQPRNTHTGKNVMKRSASTGRLPSLEDKHDIAFEGVHRRHRNHNGSGDAQPTFAM